MLSIVIPTWNAAGTLPATLACLRSARDALDGCEVIVVDAGSRDATVQLATEAGAKVISCDRGRGGQLATGADAAAGDWLLFLHADTRLQEGWQRTVARFIDIFSADGEGAKAAVFRFRLDDDSQRARLLEIIVQLRTWWLALPYGDQGLLISRRHYDAVGGYRAIPIMEDVDIVRRIGRRDVVELRCDAITSAERYRREGYFARMVRNAFCLTLWFLGVAPERIAGIYR